MISFIRGTVADLTETSVIVESGYIGFEINMTGNALAQLHIGQEVKLHTYFQVREDAMVLYGFFNKDDLQVFKLLLGLYQPQAGTVTIGGVDVARITDRERRTCIGCVEQHFSRVPGTVLEQITLGDPQITAEMARNAAKLAGIDEAIQALPESYDTVCSDGMFSQGEWQLLSIARAAAADPAVLLLDEVTANLDAETEARVLEALRRASAGRTVLSVSHRIYENLGGRTVKIEPQSM